MDNGSEIRQRIRDIAGAGNQPRVITVDVVSVQGCTCTVKYNGTDRTGVKLCAVDDDNTARMLVKPTEGSSIAVLDAVGDLSELYAIQVSDTDAVRITAGGEDMADLMAKLIDALAQAVITTPAGAGAMAPDVVTNLNQLKLKFKTLFYGTE